MKTFGITFWSLMLYHVSFVEFSWWIAGTLFLLNPFWDDLRNWVDAEKHRRKFKKEADQHAIDIEMEKSKK